MRFYSKRHWERVNGRSERARQQYLSGELSFSEYLKRSQTGKVIKIKEVKDGKQK